MSATTPAGMVQMFLLYRYGVATMDRASFGRIGAEGQDFLRHVDRKQHGRHPPRRLPHPRKPPATSEGFADFVRDEAAKGGRGSVFG